MKQDDLLYKWLNDQLSDAELAEFKLRDDYSQNLEILEAASAFKAEEYGRVADFQSFKAAYNNSKKPAGKVIRMSVWMRVAAVVVIGLGLYFTFFSSGKLQVSTLAGEKTVVMLPDNSEVQLNALSKITYKSKNWNDNRSLDLSGEAYFKVAKGKTFDVITEDGTISVLGTQFNVKRRDGYFEVKCFEGLVSVSNDTLMEQLKAGTMIRIVNNELSRGSFNDAAPAWINNFSRFDAVPFSQVTDELQRQFGVKVSLNNVNSQRLFSGRFTHDDLETAVIEITSPMNLTYELNGSTLEIHGQGNK